MAARHPVAIIAPIAWTDELRAGVRAAAQLSGARRMTRGDVQVDHPRYWFTPKVLRRWYGRFYKRSVEEAFSAAVRDFRPDVVLGSWAYPDGWAAVELGHTAGLPAAIMVHGSDILVHGQSGTCRERTLDGLKRADRIIAVSRHLADHLEEWGIPAEKISVVYNGIDSERFRPGPREEARRRLGLEERGHMILFVGNLHPVKGLDVLIDACVKLREGGPAATCYVIGQGELRDRLERQVVRLGLSDRVRLLGPRPNHDLPDWYRAVDLTVLPSLSEGLPNVLRESLACGTPFVASRVGGIAELAPEPPSRLVEAGDPAALAEAMRQALEARRPAIDRRRQMTWAESAEELVRSLEPIVLGCAGRANMTSQP
jgi:glycosyltransferase involved in cell wall biosynthesis